MCSIRCGPWIVLTETSAGDFCWVGRRVVRGDQFLTYNDDIQGTAAVIVAAALGGIKFLDETKRRRHKGCKGIDQNVVLRNCFEGKMKSTGN